MRRRAPPPAARMVSGGDSKIGSCTSIIRSNGEIFAVAHPHKKTGYKSANSETNVRMLGSKTSYKQFYEDEVALPTVTKNPKGMSYRWGTRCPPACPGLPHTTSASPASSHQAAVRRCATLCVHCMRPSGLLRPIAESPVGPSSPDSH